MSTPTRRRESEPTRWFPHMDRLLDEWTRTLPMRMPLPPSWPWPGEHLIHVDEYRENDTEVIRAELPGIDPDTDVELTVRDGMLRIRAERLIEEETKDEEPKAKAYLRHELRYGGFTRTLPLPKGASESDIKASYHNGILEIRVPVAKQLKDGTRKKITITKS